MSLLLLVKSAVFKYLLKNRKITLDENEKQAIDIIKNRLCEKPILMLPRWDLNFIVYTDASNVGIGCIITQIVDNIERVVLYDSKKFTKAQRKYDINRKEMLALVIMAEKHKFYY